MTKKPKYTDKKSGGQKANDYFYGNENAGQGKAYRLEIL